MGRRLVLMVLDAELIIFSFWLAFALRFAEPFPLLFLQNTDLLPWAVAIGLLVLFISGWYSGLTRSSGSHSLYRLLPIAGLMVLLLLLVNTLLANPHPPFRTFWILYWLVFTGSAISSRILLRDALRYRMSLRVRSSTGPGGAAQADPVPTLLFGSSDAASQLVGQLRHNHLFRFVAVIDEQPSLWGRRLHHLRIHPLAHLADLIERHDVRQAVLAMPKAPRAQRRALVNQLTELGLTVLVMPSLEQIAHGDLQLDDVRPVSIEDLLGRDPSTPDADLLRAAVSGRSVLVSGAGGSIGSELCLQILDLAPTRLVLLERSEIALFSLEQRLRLHAASHDLTVTLVPVLADVVDQPRLERLLRAQAVQVFFHAAAYKHVPLVEANVCAGVSNNVLGTRSALNASIACGLERFTLISTDKAVRPTNAMGASKRVCELLVQDAAATGARTICSMVRFGNVLGSSGSVVPQFHQQIAAGGPLTVTHPEITRYFMTIPEAVQLVLQATGLAQGGDVFVLDMGEPVKILDLARQMIHLSGFSVRDASNPQGDVVITFTGLRPGEKLFEELIISDSDETTSHPLIRRAREQRLPSDRLAELIDRLETELTGWDDAVVLAVLRELIPEYHLRQERNPLA